MSNLEAMISWQNLLYRKPTGREVQYPSARLSHEFVPFPTLPPLLCPRPIRKPPLTATPNGERTLAEPFMFDQRRVDLFQSRSLFKADVGGVGCRTAHDRGDMRCPEGLEI